MHSLANEVQYTRRWILGATVTASILLGVLYSGATLQRNTAYRDPVTFLESTLENMTPVPPHLREDVCFFEGVKNLYLTYNNLGILYRERGEWDKSAQAFENALRFTPSYFSPHYKATVKVALGGVYIQKGRLDEAFTLLLEARPDTPKPSVADNLLGIIAITLSEKEKAALYFKRALLENKDYAPAHHNLGILYIESDRAQMGIQELMEAARLNPHYTKTLSQYGLSPYCE
jgi:tetratricopeptide (TPR) repeat protein